MGSTAEGKKVEQSHPLSPGVRAMNPHLFPTNETAPRTEVPNPKPQRHKKTALERSIPREEESLPRVTVRFIGYRVQPLDPDNFAGSCKDLLDGLRHATLIRGDEPWRIRFETEQYRVAHYAQEKTVIELDLP